VVRDTFGLLHRNYASGRWAAQVKREPWQLFVVVTGLAGAFLVMAILCLWLVLTFGVTTFSDPAITPVVTATV
jgi:hypothetical protein